MKTKLIMVLCITALVMMCGTAVADWNVTWTPVKESIIDKEYLIAVQNLEDENMRVNLSAFFAETSFDIHGIQDVKLFERGKTEYELYHPASDCYEEIIEVYCPINNSWSNYTVTTCDTPAYTTIEERPGWIESKPLDRIFEGDTLKSNSLEINIPRLGSTDEDEGIINGTKFFLMTFTTPVHSTAAGFGSTGKVAILLDDVEHHPYWDVSYLHRKEIFITGETGAGTHYQVSFDIGDITGGDFNLSGGCTNFPEDIRVTNMAGTTELAYWIEDLAADPIKMWVEVVDDLGSNQTVWIYYGKSGATTESNIEDTFISGFDFSGFSGWTGDTTKCTANQTFQGKTECLKCYDDSGSSVFNIKHSVSFPSAFVIEGNIAQDVDHYSSINAGDGSVDVRMGWAFRPTGSNISYYWDGTSYTLTDVTPSLNTWYQAKLVAKGGTGGVVDMYIDNVLKLSNKQLSAIPTLFKLTFVGGSGQGSAYYNSLRVRKYNSPEPTFSSAGAEQSYAGSIHYNATNPYNHTIESDGTIIANHSITTADNINWTAAAVSGDCYLVVTEYNLANATIANFTTYNASLDWLRVTNLTAGETYKLANSTTYEQQTADANGEANFTTDLIPGDYQILPSSFSISLFSSHPATIYTNHTGIVTTNYIVTSPNSLNLSSLAFLYGINYTATGDMHGYVVSPPNSIASEGIYRAPNRNSTPYLSWEYNDTITEGNVWQWGGGDNDSVWITKTPIDATHTWINVTGVPEHIFQSSVYLKKLSMYNAPKTGFEINSQQGLIIKMWDTEVIRGRSIDYLMNLYFDTGWESTMPTDPIEIWYCNSSFNPDTDDPTGENCTKIVEWDGNRWVNHSWVPGTNASYCIPLTMNASGHAVTPDEINYIYLTSPTQSSKSYILNATNHDPGICNITYAQTETMWTYSELAGASSPVAYTPSFFTTFVRDDEEMLHHLYIANEDGDWAHSGIQSIPIGVSHFPVSAASINYFNFTCPIFGYTHDDRMDATYDGGSFFIGLDCPADPDGGVVSHNLTLHYANETIVAVINDTFTTTGDESVEINFATTPYYSTNDAYTLKCVSTDDEGTVAIRWLDSYFTLAADGTQGHYVNDYLMFWGMNDVPTLYAVVNNDSYISYDVGSDIYTMHVPFFKSKCNDTFRFNETVHLESLNTEDVAYFMFHGVTIFDGANIHGWNTVTDAAAPTTDAYRGYLIAHGRTTGNISNSDLSYLGSDVYRQEGVNFIDNNMDYLIYNTTLSHNSRGALFEECDGAVNISHCTVSDNAETGVGIYYSDNFVVENCTVSGSEYDPGIYLYEASDNTIRYNTIQDNVGYGIRIRSNSNNNTLIGNDITGSVNYDYYFTSDSVNNTIRDPASTTDKIRVLASSGVNIENTDNAAFSEDSSNLTYAYPANFSMRVAATTQTFDITQHDITVTPDADSVQIWNIAWSHIVSFNASNVSGSPQVWFNITHPMWANTNVSIYRNDTIYANETADASGHITFNYTGGWSEHWFEFVPGNLVPDQPTVVTPADGATGTSTNPTLRVQVTDANSYDLINVTFYTPLGAQIGSTQTGITNGSTASVVWPGRSYSTTYYWYAVADDGTAQTQSDTWDFTTQGSGSGSSHVISITGCTDWSENAGNQVYIDFGATGETSGATFTTTATSGSIDPSTGVYTWTTVPADAGVYTWRFNVENVYGISDYCDVTITLYHFASPTTLTATTGNFWVDHTWGGNGFADSYNVSVNDVWLNSSTAQSSYHVRYPHAWSNISVAAFNNTTGLSSFVSNDVQVPNNAIVLTNYAALMLATAGDTVTVDMNHEDLDGDVATYYCSRMDLFADFNTADGTGQYMNAINGTHEVIFGVTDGYGWDNETITIEVGQVHPLELDEETPLMLFVVLVVLLFGSLFYIYHAASYVAKIVTALISTWMSFMLSNMAVSGNVVLNYAELSAGDVFIYGAHSIQIAALSHFFMFTGVVSAMFMLVFAIKLVIDTYLDMQDKRKADEEWDGVTES